MLALLLTPAVLSALILGAHFLRRGQMVPLLACLVAAALPALRHPQARRVLQFYLLLGTLEWLRTLGQLVAERRELGEPWAGPPGSSARSRRSPCSEWRCSGRDACAIISRRTAERAAARARPVFTRAMRARLKPRSSSPRLPTHASSREPSARRGRPCLADPFDSQDRHQHGWR